LEVKYKYNFLAEIQSKYSYFRQIFRTRKEPYIDVFIPSISAHPKIEYDSRYAEHQTIRVGSMMSIDTRIGGFPRPKVTWTLNEKPLPVLAQVKTTDDSSSLHVKNISPQYAGTYKITVQNDVGSVSAEFVVNIRDKPSKPTDLEIIDIQRNSITIKWQPPMHDGGAEITGYTIERRDMKRSMWTMSGETGPEARVFVITKLIEGNDYCVRVYANNKIGASEPTELKTPTTVKSPYGKSRGQILYRKLKNFHNIFAA
jgi:titin